MTSRIGRTLPVIALVVAAGAFPAAAPASVTEFGGLTAGTPGGITTGPDGALWFTEQGSPGAIGRITTGGSVTEYVAGVVPGFTADSDPVDIATGPDGALWFTEQGVTGAIGRLDPGTGTVTEYTCPTASSRPPTASSSSRRPTARASGGSRPTARSRRRRPG